MKNAAVCFVLFSISLTLHVQHLLIYYSCLSLSEQGSGSYLNLTDLIGFPLPPSVSFTAGFEGHPAYKFGSQANVGRLTKTFVPGSFYRDFAIIVTVTLQSSSLLDCQHAQLS